jgi:DNA-binding PadR family transcriptional regulator
MYKELMLLGLLADHPMYGQQIREVIERHHDAFSSFIKKPTMYYQLDRLVAEDLLEVRSEAVEAPGPGLAHQDVALREREVYYLTEAGRLLQGRRERLARARSQLTEQIAAMREQDRAHVIVNDHTRSLLDTEIGWLERTITRLSLPRETTREPERVS